MKIVIIYILMHQAYLIFFFRIGCRTLIELAGNNYKICQCLQFFMFSKPFNERGQILYLI